MIESPRLRGESAFSLGESVRELVRASSETVAESQRLREQARMHRRTARRIKERGRLRRGEPARGA